MVEIESLISKRISIVMIGALAFLMWQLGDLAGEITSGSSSEWHQSFKWIEVVGVILWAVSLVLMAWFNRLVKLHKLEKQLNDELTVHIRLVIFKASFFVLLTLVWIAITLENFFPNSIYYMMRIVGVFSIVIPLTCFSWLEWEMNTKDDFKYRIKQ